MDHLLPKGCYALLHIGTGPSGIEQKSDSPLVVTDVAKRFVLSDEIWLERLDEQLAKNIQKACEPPHYNIDSEGRDRHLYAFVRQIPDVEKSRYEGMSELFAVVALSRLIHPTSTGDRYCARVFHFGVRGSPIQAIQWMGISPDVFLGKGLRDWLSLQDGEDLRKLMPWVSKDKPMHKRIHRAYWYHEYAVRSYYLDARWTLVVSGLEALVSTGTHELTEKFVSRLSQIARELQIDFTDDELKLAYKLRSKLSHAESFLYDLVAILPKEQQHELYDRMESLLRRVLKRSLLDEEFGNFFRDDATVEARWPV